MTGPTSVALKIWPAASTAQVDPLLNFIERAVEALPDRDREIVRRRNGFDGQVEKLEEVAKRFSLSVAAISQLEKKALERVALAVDQACRGGVTLDNLRMEDLGLTNRTRRLIANAGVRTIHDLCTRPREFYESLPGFGEGCMKNLERELEKFRIRLPSQQATQGNAA